MLITTSSLLTIDYAFRIEENKVESLYGKRHRQNRPRGHEAVVIPPLGASEIARALAQDFSLRAGRWNNVGRVGPRSVLFLLYLKQDQMINLLKKTTMTVFIYLTIMGGAMLNASPLRQAMLINDSFYRIVTLVFTTRRKS